MIKIYNLKRNRQANEQAKNIMAIGGGASKHCIIKLLILIRVDIATCTVTCRQVSTFPTCMYCLICLILIISTDITWAFVYLFFKYSVIYISILSSFVSNCVVLQKDIWKYNIFFCILFTVHFSKKLITILLFIMSWLISLWMSLPSTYCIILLIRL